MKYLKQYHLKLKTLSPLFIGSGDSLTKKEYLFLPQSKKICFVNLQKLFKLLESKNQTDAYEAFVLSEQKDLYAWLVGKNFTQEKIHSVQSYSVDAGNAMDTANGFNLTGIQLFVRNGLGYPYVPGSSIKGAIRTAILANLTSKGNYEHQLGSYRDALKRNTHEPLKYESKEVEAECLNSLQFYDNHGNKIPRKNEVTSIMRGIQISDGKPLTSKCMTLCAKIDVNTEGKSKKIDVARECICPGTISEHLLTLDTQILAEAHLDIPAIRNAICRAYEIQSQYFLSKFPRTHIDSTSSNGFELFMGGGTGFLSKTMLYPMLKDDGLSLTTELMKRQFPNHYHDSDATRGVSPHMLKCTQYDGRLYLMGRCEVEIS